MPLILEEFVLNMYLAMHPDVKPFFVLCRHKDCIYSKMAARILTLDSQDIMVFMPMCKWDSGSPIQCCVMALEEILGKKFIYCGKGIRPVDGGAATVLKQRLKDYPGMTLDQLQSRVREKLPYAYESVSSNYALLDDLIQALPNATRAGV